MELNTKEFKEKVFDMDKDTQKYLGDKPCVIDFHSLHCGPCKILKKSLEKIENERDDVYIYTVDVNKEPDLQSAFNIQAVPSVLYLNMEGIGKMDMGAKPKTIINKLIDDNCI